MWNTTTAPHRTVAQESGGRPGNPRPPPDCRGGFGCGCGAVMRPACRGFLRHTPRVLLQHSCGRFRESFMWRGVRQRGNLRGGCWAAHWPLSRTTQRECVAVPEDGNASPTAASRADIGAARRAWPSCGRREMQYSKAPKKGDLAVSEEGVYFVVLLCPRSCAGRYCTACMPLYPARSYPDLDMAEPHIAPESDLTVQLEQPVRGYFLSPP